MRSCLWTATGDMECQRTDEHFAQTYNVQAQGGPPYTSTTNVASTQPMVHAAVLQLQSMISGMQSSLKGNVTVDNINQISSTLQNMLTQVNTLASKAAPTDGKMGAYFSQVVNQLNSIIAQVNTYKQQFASNAQGVTSLTNNIDSLNSQLTTLNSQLTNMNSQQKATSAQAASSLGNNLADLSRAIVSNLGT